MMNLLHKLLATLALAAATAMPCHAVDGKDYNLVAYTVGGTRTAFASGGHPKLIVSGSAFTITTDAAKSGYEGRDLLRFTLEDDSGEPLADAYWLVISLRDGTIEAVPFTDRPTITITGETFSVTSSARAIDYAATAVDRFRVADHYDAEHHALNADVNGDGSVDVADIAAIISVMARGAEPQSGSARNPADVNGDGAVDVADIASVISVMASR